MQGQDLINARDTSGATKLYNQLSDINAQAVGLQNEAQAIPIANRMNYQKGGIAGTDSQVNNVNYDQLQQNALKALSLGQQAAIVSGQYDKAKNYADQIVNAKYDKIKADIDAKLSNLQSLEKYTLAPAEKKVAEATTARLNKEKQDAEKKIADEKAVSDMIIQASPVAPADVLARAKAIQAKGGSAMEVASALGVYGDDYLAREKIKSEIKKMDADAAKTRANANAVSGAGSPSATSNAKAWIDQYNSGALSLEDIYTKIGNTKEAGVLKNQVAQLVAAQGGKRVYGQDDASVQAINAQIKNVNDLLSGDVGSIVGIVQGGLGVLPDKLNVYKQDALAVAKNLVSNQTLQSLADAKAKGITFGALSEAELNAVSNASGRIASKLIKDKDGNVTGFSGSEGEFKKDLQTVKDGLQKSIATKTQSTQPNQSKEDTTADDIMRANSNVQKQITSTYNIFDK